MQTSIKVQASKLFAKNPAYRQLFAFADGNIFSNENFAKAHQLQCKMQYEVITRSEVLGLNAPAKNKKVTNKPTKDKATKDKPAKEKVAKEKPDVRVLADQLKEMDLSKPEGAMYNTYKMLADGLAIPRANNKLETILETLVEAQKKFTNNTEE